MNNLNRIIVFKRYEADQQLLIVASLNNHVFGDYRIESDAYRLPDGIWKEIFNSDASLYEVSGLSTTYLLVAELC